MNTGGPGFQNALTKFLYRYHLVLFVILVIGSMAAVIYQINQSLNNSTDTSDNSSSIATSFDQKTIDRVNALRPTNNLEPLKLPNSRSNPFME